MQGQIAGLAALAMYAQVLNPPASGEIANLQQAQLFPAKPMIQKG